MTNTNRPHPVVTSQPADTPVFCPPGLEPLASLDKIMIHQEIEIIEILTSFETKNKYRIVNGANQIIFYAAEQSSVIARCCFSTIRPFQMILMDGSGTEVINLNRPFKCESCCFPCCLQVMEVSSPPDTLIGRVVQRWSPFIPKFEVQDPTGNVVFIIKGHCCVSCKTEPNFNVFSRDGTSKVGEIQKKWSGYLKEMFTDADDFGIEFPLDLDVRMKAVLLGACFLMDYMYFEV